MPIQSSMFSKRPITVMTFEWPLPCVHSLMTEQWPFLSESSATKWTNIRQDAGVSSQVNLHGILKIKSQHDYHHNLFNLKRETYTKTMNTVVPSSEIMYHVPVLTFVLKVLRHTVQLNGRSMVWILRCSLTWEILLNSFPHWPHLKFLVSLWTLRCFVRVSLVMKLLWQCIHLWGLSPSGTDNTLHYYPVNQQ